VWGTKKGSESVKALLSYLAKRNEPKKIKELRGRRKIRGGGLRVGNKIKILERLDLGIKEMVLKGFKM